MRLQNPSGSGLAIGEADNRYLRLAGGTMTGELNALAGLNTVRPYSSGIVPAGLSDPAPAFPFETEWNNAGKNWTAVRVSVTNTASGSGSKLQDWQVGGFSKCYIDRLGVLVSANTTANDPAGNGCWVVKSASNYGLSLANGGNGALVSYVNGAIGAGLLTTALLIPNASLFGWSSSPSAAGANTALERESEGLLKFTDGAGSLRDWKARRGSLSEYLDIAEMSAPAAPSANTARLYVEDNGSGKTRLCVRFPTGAVQVLATEP